MKLFHCTALALALAAAFPAQAQSNADVMRELQALKDKVTELEGKLLAQVARAPAAPTAGQWGMTPDQARELNRVAVKTEALEDAFEAQGLKQFKFSGFMDPTFIVNRARHSAGARFLNDFPASGQAYTYDNSYFGMLGLDLQKEMEGGTRWRFTLVPHKSTGANYNYPSIVHEATVSIPLGDLQTRFWAGQLPDWSGYEYFLPNQNKFITHNMLFDYAAPTYYTGAGVDITRGKWIVKGAVGNMNISRYGDKRQGPVASYRVDYAKGEFNGFGFAGQHGKVDSLVAPLPQRLDMFELDGYFIRGDLTAQGQVAIGRQQRSASNGEDARWWGVSTLAAYKLTPRFEVSSRLDYLNNRRNGGNTLNVAAGNSSTCPNAEPLCPDGANGIGPGMTFNDLSGQWEAQDPNRGTNRWALSLGANYLFNLNTTFKVEARIDTADQRVFLDVKNGEYRKSNAMFGSSVVVSF